MGGDEGLLRRLIDMFLVNYPKQLSELHDAVRERDVETLRRRSHTLRGAFVALRRIGGCRRGAPAGEVGGVRRPRYRRSVPRAAGGTGTAGTNAQHPGTRGATHDQSDRRLITS